MLIEKWILFMEQGLQIALCAYEVLNLKIKHTFSNVLDIRNFQFPER
jgi:hypothetical protein